VSESVDLVWLGNAQPASWTLGRTIRAEASPTGLHRVTSEELERSDAAAWLFWDGRLGRPDPERIGEAVRRPGDVWHAGLRLGMGGLPSAIDFVAPTWMLNRDPDPSIEATSWRLSLQACLARTEVLRRLGGVRPEFETLTGAALELGHRWVTRGALMRHLPHLSPVGGAAAVPELPFEDEMRFVFYGFGRRWLRWSLWRSVLTKRIGFVRARQIRRQLERRPVPGLAAPFRNTSRPDGPRQTRSAGSVTVLIPTVDRYPYLEKLLEQLRVQTVRPLEIIVVDQTPPARRRADLFERFHDLPLRVFLLEQAGQCSSRNKGLEASRGTFVLFVDDDDEVPPDLIERHLGSLQRFGAEVSCGVADEDGAGPLPEAFSLIRASDVFPTNNALIQKAALSRSGLFDLAFDRGARADADLGMRLYLSGCLMVLNPEIRALHHHAPSGGLRMHGARVITYASSRKRLTHRHIPAVTEIYLARRYFSASQLREMLWLQTAATLAFRGSRPLKLLKALVGLILLPDTVRRVRQRVRKADALFATGPRIPQLPEISSAPGILSMTP
jgi:GT2 family glycosyltransferase